MKKYLKFILPFLAIAFIYALSYHYGRGAKAPVPETLPAVLVKGIEIPVEIADTPEKQVQGLSDRPFLEEDKGMLFVFGDKKARSFWMKNMHFPLDIVWIDGGRIVKISPDLPPEGENPANHYFSDAPVDYVLEVNGGFCEKYGIKAGDELIIKHK